MQKITISLVLCFVSLNCFSGQWFKDQESDCAVWGEHEQPIVSVSWSGDCLDGKAHGNGSMEVYIENIPFSRYEGEYKAGKAHGFGVLVSPDQSRYEGQFRENVMHGHGVIISKDGKRLEGEYYDGFPHGKLIATTPDGETVEMEFKNGRRVK